MTKQIDKLTPEQEALIPQYVEKYLAIGLSTEPANREVTEDAIARAYATIDKPVPPIKWASSPMKAQLMIASMETGIPEEKLEKKDITYKYGCYAGQDLYWLAFYKFLHKELGAEYNGQDYEPVMDVACNAGWWYPFEEVCIVCERPSVIKMQDGRLHCPDGPAISYGDGLLDVYAWRGTTVPKEWIEDTDNVDPTLALTHDNLEQRRCLAEIIGWDKVLQQLEPVVIDTDEDPTVGQLLEVEIPDSGKERFLKVRCGTGRDFVLCVPPDTKTALQAQSLMWGVPEEVYRNLEVRT